MKTVIEVIRTKWSLDIWFHKPSETRESYAGMDLWTSPNHNNCRICKLCNIVGHITSLGIKVVYGLNLFVDIPVKSDISYQTSISDYMERTIVKDAKEEISHFGSIQNKICDVHTKRSYQIIYLQRLCYALQGSDDCRYDSSRSLDPWSGWKLNQFAAFCTSVQYGVIVIFRWKQNYHGLGQKQAR